ncbi:uncharacterized protein LOC115231668 [Octopus sinensis]|uniref:Uncharacterized protein LOC115231668 n=1 Tax=Octopus sinensis TaxID=2607531 RepID=A0A6P7TYE1_9MOLL|nr:uncharacterized protein LOC115231668 [Octopus sinensis]
MEDVNYYFESSGLERNFDKSATNSYLLRNDGKLIDGLDSYRYLGVLENRCSKVLKEDVLKNIKEEMQNRIEKLSETKLNSVNLFKAINEHALSPCNYYIGLIDLEPCELEEIDKLVRKILMNLNVHMKPACKERLLTEEYVWKGIDIYHFQS